MGPARNFSVPKVCALGRKTIILQRDCQHTNIINPKKMTDMKKLLIIAAMAISSMTAFAQQAAGSFSVQPKIGLNIASLTDAKDSDPRFGLAVGAEFMYQATDIVGISFGALYSMQGCKYDDVTIKLDYINVPVLANVYVAKGLAVKLGLQPGFNVNSSAKAHGVEADTDDTKTVDLSMPIGLSYEFSNFVIDGRYNWGLTKVAKDSDCKNSVFQFTVGYKFSL